MNPRCRQGLFERVAIELWQAAGHGKRTNVDERLDAVGLQCSDQIIEAASRVSDRVKGGQLDFDAVGRLGDALECRRDESILVGKYGAKIEKNLAFFNAGDD